MKSNYLYQKKSRHQTTRSTKLSGCFGSPSRIIRAMRTYLESPKVAKSDKNSYCKQKAQYFCKYWVVLAPRVGFEPTTYRLTAECSTAELSRNISLLRYYNKFYCLCQSFFLYFFIFFHFFLCLDVV